MNKNTIIALVVTSILLIIGSIVGLIFWLVSRSRSRWPSDKISKFRKFLRNLPAVSHWSESDINCYLDYYTSISIHIYKNMNQNERDKRHLRAMDNCGLHLNIPNTQDLGDLFNEIFN